MIKRFFIIAVTFFLCFLGKAQVMFNFTKDSVYTWKYDSGDEFDATEINKTIWQSDYGFATSLWGNKEQQYYSPWQNHAIKNGCLNLNAVRKKLNVRLVNYLGDDDSIFNGKKFDGLNKRNFNFSAGLIQSKEDYLYGYFEIKFKMSDTKGFWPAFWLYGSTPNEEIDFMELKSEFKNKIHVGRHSQKKEENYFRTWYFEKLPWGEWVSFKGSLIDSFNVVSGEWNENEIKYYLNGELIAYAPLKFKNAKKLVANIAVPANNGPFKPGPSDSTNYSGDFKIDYIRVWKPFIPNQKTKSKDIDTKFAIEKNQISQTKLKSKKKVIIGKKQIRERELFWVSLIELKGKQIQVSALGRKVEGAELYFISDKNEVLDKKKLIYGEQLLNVPPFAVAVTIKQGGKLANYFLSSL